MEQKPILTQVSLDKDLVYKILKFAARTETQLQADQFWTTDRCIMLKSFELGKWKSDVLKSVNKKIEISLTDDAVKIFDWIKNN